MGKGLRGSANEVNQRLIKERVQRTGPLDGMGYVREAIVTLLEGRTG